MEGPAALAEAEVPEMLRELASQLAAGTIELPVAATYALDHVTDAFETLERRHTLRKIVLIP